MPTDPAEGFADNWAYLKTELNWLDRMLMLAVARQRKESKDLDRLSHSRADRATSPWWKGVISLEGKIAYDEHRTPASEAKQTYQQQLDSKIQASQKQGVFLSLPSLRDRLGLSLFEKNLILMSLAPEINRRYAKLYRYLQGDDASIKTDLPTVDLVLRLLCRNDGEWRSARAQLASSSALIHHRLIMALPVSDTFLNNPLKLSDALVEFLLAENPTPQVLERLLHYSDLSYSGQAATPRQFTQSRTSAVDWSDLVLPTEILAGLQQVSQHVQQQTQVDEVWGFEHKSAVCGTLTLLIGAAGTGKTMAASAIATSLQLPLTVVDLGQIAPEDDTDLLQELAAQMPKVLLIKSAQNWLGRSPRISPIAIQQFLQTRRSLPGVTLFSVTVQHAVKLCWQQQLDQLLHFPLPDSSSRLRLWQQAFPNQVPLAAEIDWDSLAEQLHLTGGTIGAIAREAAFFAAAEKATRLEMNHIVQAIAQRGLSFKPKQKAKPKRKSAKATGAKSTAAKRRSTRQRNSSLD
jgi:hypothetical protein